MVVKIVKRLYEDGIYVCDLSESEFFETKDYKEYSESLKEYFESGVGSSWIEYVLVEVEITPLCYINLDEVISKMK